MTARRDILRSWLGKPAMAFGGLLVAGSALAATVSCGAGLGTASPSPDGKNTSDAGAPAPEATGVTGPSRFPGSPDSARGLILVHASPNLPAFRLCFGTVTAGGSLLPSASSSLRPLPDRELMPDSNVVGVEIGSAVRLKPLTDVGVQATDHVFAIPEVEVRPGSGSDLPCTARICPTNFSSTCLEKDPPGPGQRGYYDLGPLPPGADAAGVQLLVLHGCVRGSGDARTCGAGFNMATGNMAMDALRLASYKTSSSSQFLVQVAQLSGAVATSTLGVTYGALDGGAKPARTIPMSSAFGQLGPPGGLPSDLTLDRNDTGVYASYGFQLSVGGQTFTKSLAQVQLLTAPQALPNDFYAATSNFVFVLLGDPSLSDVQGKALSDLTDPGLLLHLLAIPVGQATAADGGSNVSDAAMGDAQGGG